MTKRERLDEEDYLDANPNPPPHYFQLPFRQLLSQYGYLSAPLRPEPRGPAENAPQGEPQRSEGSPLLDLLP